MMSAGPSFADIMCDVRGARPSGREELIELMVDSAVCLIGKESIDGGRKTERPRKWLLMPLSTYVCSHAP